MTLFESIIRKLDIPRCVIDDIVALRNICMEAEQPAQAQPQPQEQAKPAQQQPPQQTQPQNAQPQNAPQQPAQNGQEQPAAQQGQGQQGQQEKPQEQAQQPNQQENKQAAQKGTESITPDQVDANKLMKVFNNYVESCKQKLKQKIETEFGEDGKKIMNTVEQYVNSNSAINFDDEIAPFITKDGKPITDSKILNDIRGRLEKYFGAKFMSGKPAEQKPEQKQEQPSKENGEQPDKQAQPAK